MFSPRPQIPTQFFQTFKYRLRLVEAVSYVTRHIRHAGSAHKGYLGSKGQGWPVDKLSWIFPTAGRRASGCIHVTYKYHLYQTRGAFC